MREEIVLSCPFCHAKSAYRDAPPGSTVRCEECESIFRVPPLHRRTAGGVIKGEAIRGSGKKKLTVALLVLLVLAAGGALAWQVLVKHDVVVHDPFSDLPYPEDSSHGTLMRFLQSWTLGEQALMLRYCRAGDRAVNPDRDQAKKFEDWLQASFGNVKLVSYRLTGVIPVSDALNEYRVELTGEDPRTKAPLKGRMSPKVFLEDVPQAKGKWGVDVHSATPRWD